MTARSPNYLLLLLLFTLGVGLPELYATHNRAGEIFVEQVDCGNTFALRAVIRTWTKASSTGADRDSLTLCWGDGFCEKIGRSNGNGNGVPLGNDIKFNTYESSHVYAGRGTYTVSMGDPNRNAGIENVNFPNSEQVPFFISTTYTFQNPLFEGCNTTPILLNPPIDDGCIGQPFTHNPGAFDIDGDSLSYRLVTPLQDDGIEVPNYRFPNTVSGNEGSGISLNPTSGQFVWDSPQKAGEYNIAMIIISWRNGVAIDTVLRDIQFTIRDCGDNQQPQIETIDEICVVAGTFVEFDVTATDPDMLDQLRLTAAGGPFFVDVSPAQDEAIWTDQSFNPQPVTKTFRWQTTCEHISDQPYSVVFTATDNFFDTTGLSNSKTVFIKVVGPAPEDVQAEPDQDVIDLSWASPYACEDAADNYFFGFSVWRREASNSFPVNTCTPGLAGRGYTLIAPRVLTLDDGRYRYVDDDVERGRTYCYRILAQFARFTNTTSPEPYNLVESLPSDEVCVQLSRDIPLITNVSVRETDVADGEIFVRWTKPVIGDLDTLLNPPPYRYQLLRAEGITSTGFAPVPGATFVSNSFSAANDTTFVDTGLNTVDNAYTYILEFYTGSDTNEPLGVTTNVSSVYLNVGSTDETNNLSWDFDVPWDNFEFLVYRQNSAGGFDSLALVSESAYADEDLVNGREYCYYIEARGSYGVDNVMSPLFNRSQRACGAPLDTIPPCPPVLRVQNICAGASSCVEEELENTLSWTNPIETCAETDDVVGYRLYYAAVEGAPFALIEEFDSPFDTLTIHRPENGLAGCYAVTAIDTFFNESPRSNVVCVDNCPIYELPNTFTPNGDGRNDLFVPYPYCFIERVEFEVFNRWGERVFRSESADLDWDGTNESGQALAAGTYYYVCKVFEQRVTGVVEREEPLSGWIQLID